MNKIVNTANRKRTDRKGKGNQPPFGPWDDIKEHDRLSPGRKILPESEWEKGSHLVTSALLMGLIGPRNSHEEACKSAVCAAWGLPLHISDEAASFAEALAALRYTGGFAINSLLKPEMVIFRSKREANSYIKATPSARKASSDEICAFLMEKASSAPLVS